MRAAKVARTLLIAAVTLSVLIGIAYLVVFVGSRFNQLTAETDRCEIRVGDQLTTLTPTQAHYASIIVGVAVQRNLPVRAATVAIATAYQESKIVNIDYGDRDSLGLFQQRPSQGWGTAEQIMDPYYSTNAFYNALVKVRRWQQMSITQAAQAVQRSAYPDAYARHEANARAVATALVGESQAVLNCLHRDVTVGDGYALSAFISATFGKTAKVEVSGTQVVITTRDAAHSWAVAHSMVANYARYAITSVTTDGRKWAPQDAKLGSWASGEPSPPTTVTLTLSG